MQATPSISISVPERARRNCRHLYSVSSEMSSGLTHEMILKQGYDNCLAHHVIFSEINQETKSVPDNDFIWLHYCLTHSASRIASQVDLLRWHDSLPPGKLNSVDFFLLFDTIPNSKGVPCESLLWAKSC
jgi:hypothetical protein